ncbi:MAG: biotin transporter BioY [Bacteroides sp.]|nr:biotin transporter BioY [Bacteroides sp.]MCM1549242.1 biotin transporter BioY [Clostridium sp.]
MREEQKQRITTKNIVMIGLFAAIIAVLAQISIPTPWGIPITLQTLAVALTGYCLGKAKGTLATVIYIIIGLAGVPVYAGFGAGPAKLLGVTGGYIYGFLFLAFACGLEDILKKKWLSIVSGILGLLLCHVCGSIQFAFVSGRTFAEAFLYASLPYLLKDVISVAVAYGLAVPIRKVMGSFQNAVEAARD